jgi:hypothetical protein
MTFWLAGVLSCCQTAEHGGQTSTHSPDCRLPETALRSVIPEITALVAAVVAVAVVVAAV